MYMRNYLCVFYKEFPDAKSNINCILYVSLGSYSSLANFRL